MPLSASGDGPLLNTVPFRWINESISRILLLEPPPSSMTVRLGAGVMLNKNALEVGLM